MVNIVSFSVDENTQKELDKAVKDLEFKNRSEMIRAAVRTLVAEKQELEKLKGKTTAVAVVVHATDADDSVTEIRHSFGDIVSTQVHNTSLGDCLEVFVLSGDAKRIIGFAQQLKKNRKVKYSRVMSTKTI